VRTCFPAEWCERVTSEAIKATFPAPCPLFIAGFKVQNASLLDRIEWKDIEQGRIVFAMLIMIFVCAAHITNRKAAETTQC